MTFWCHLEFLWILDEPGSYDQILFLKSMQVLHCFKSWSLILCFRAVMTNSVLRGRITPTSRMGGWRGRYIDRSLGSVVGRGYYCLWTIAVLTGRNIGLRVE
jgi:hypothetical protein